jgi:hypothetical protein
MPGQQHNLVPLPPGFAAARAALHRVAEDVLAPERKPDNEISLRVTPGGFGTPPFEWEGSEHQVRVDGTELVRERDGVETRTPLDVDAESARALAEWFALGADVLEVLRGEAGPGNDPSIVRLWPEHFDVAIEAGDEAAGRRANYGFSPGDDDHPEPYLYVGPWSGEVEGELWNAQGFTGAELGYAELRAAADPAAAALEFCRERRDALNAD